MKAWFCVSVGKRFDFKDCQLIGHILAELDERGDDAAEKALNFPRSSEVEFLKIEICTLHGKNKKPISCDEKYITSQIIGIG